MTERFMPDVNAHLIGAGFDEAPTVTEARPAAEELRGQTARAVVQRQVLDSLAAVSTNQLAAWFAASDTEDAMTFIRAELARRIQARATEASAPLFEPDELREVPMSTLFALAEGK